MIGFTLLACFLLSSLFAGQLSLSTDNAEMSKILAVDFEVFGIVQGVFFRKVSKLAHIRPEVPGVLIARLPRNAIDEESTREELETRSRGIYQYTQKRGKELGLKGWCMNTSNGTVVGHLEGEKAHIDEMKQWLRYTGSPQSRIDKAEFRNEKEISQPSFSNFEIRK